MNWTGSLFVEDSVKVVDDADSKWPVAILCDGLGGLFVNMSYELGQQLHSQLGDALRSIEHDRESA